MDITTMFRSDCTCGWSFEDADAALVSEEAEKHRMQNDGVRGQKHGTTPPKRVHE